MAERVKGNTSYQYSNLRTRLYPFLGLVLLCGLFVSKSSSSFARSLLSTENVASMALRAAAPEKNNVEMIVMIQGPKTKYPHWANEQLSLQGVEGISLSFIYAAFDKELPENTCSYMTDSSIDCETMFIPRSTWTMGRNTMAGRALEKEKARNKKYDWWLFLDDDAEFNCAPEAYLQDTWLPRKGTCIQKVLQFLTSDHIPEKVTNVAFFTAPDAKPYLGTVSTTDALLAAFKRQYVPYFLPYAAPPKCATEWLSQAANHCVMKACFPQTAMGIPYVVFGNGSHRPYPRGEIMDNFYATLERNYDKTIVNTCKAMQHTWGEQMSDPSPSYTIGRADLERRIPDHDLELCKPLKTRFEEWEAKEGWKTMENLYCDTYYEKHAQPSSDE